MSDSQKLSRVRWAIRDILQFLQSDRRVPRSRVEKAVRCLKEADFADSAALLEAEFRPVFFGRKSTPELLLFVQSLFHSIDNAVSQRMEHEICPEGVGNTTTPDQPPSNADATPLTGKTGEGEGGGGANADKEIRDLESETPPLDRNSGKWISNKRAAQLEGVETRTLADYRLHGIKNAAKTLGRDKDGRVWRREGTPNSHPQYLRSTLRAK